MSTVALSGVETLDLRDTRDNWKKIKKLYPASQYSILNLNSGSCGVMPQPVINRYTSAIQAMNNYAPYELVESWESIRNQNKARLASYLAVKPTELAIVRNTTEGVNNILTGIAWQEGDEILYSDAEYPSNINMLQRLVRLYGVRLRPIQIDLNTLSDREIVATYKSNISAKTRLVLVSYVAFREAIILPIKDIVEVCHDADAEVLVDAAHAFGHFDHSISELGCDYYACSLHKWLTAPQGTGIVYIKESKIIHLDPANGHPTDMDGIEKMEYLGTHNFATDVGIAAALDFLDVVGIVNKQSRLRELNKYWIDKANRIEGMNTYGGVERRCGLGLFSHNSIGAGKFVRQLEEQYSIHVKNTKTPQVDGNSVVRISMNLFVDETDLDKLVEGIEAIVRSNQ